jgi:hypothetical protein
LLAAIPGYRASPQKKGLEMGVRKGGAR